MVCLKDCTVFYQITWKKCLIHAPLWEGKDNKLLGKMFSEKVFAKRDLYIPHVHTWQPLAILHLPVSNCHNFCYMYERISSYEPLILFGFRFGQIAHYLTFEWFMVDFERKKYTTKFLGKTISYTLKKIFVISDVKCWKKILHRYMWGKKMSNSRGLGKNYYLKITHTPLPNKRPMVMSTI